MEAVTWANASVPTQRATIVLNQTSQSGKDTLSVRVYNEVGRTSRGMVVLSDPFLLPVLILVRACEARRVAERDLQSRVSHGLRTKVSRAGCMHVRNLDARI